MSPGEERALVQWVEQLSCTGNPVRHSFLRELAQEIRKPRVENADYVVKDLGKHWVSRFLARNPSLQSKVAKSIEAARKEVTEKQLQNWFSMFKRIMDENNCHRGLTLSGLPSGHGAAPSVLWVFVTYIAN